MIGAAETMLGRRIWTPEPVVEVNIVAPIEPEAPPVAPGPPAAAAPPPSRAVAPEAAVADQAREPEPAPTPQPATESPAEIPAAENPATEPPAKPPQKVEKVEKPAPHPKPPRPEVPAQTAARVPLPPSSHGVDGPSSLVLTDAGRGAQVRPVVSPKPEYPRIAIELGEQGTVIVTVEVGTDGAPKQVTVLHSSGFGSLDQAAVQAVSQWRFAPAVKGNPVNGVFNIPLVFKFKHSGG